MRTVFVWLVISLCCFHRNVNSVSKRQVKVGQYFFPRTASFPDYGWNSDGHDNAEPLYDEIILLPQERKLSSAEKIDRNQERVASTSMVNHQSGFKPTPPFAPPRMIVDEKHLADSRRQVFSKSKNLFAFDNSTNSEEIFSKGHSYNLLDDYQQISNNDFKEIHVIPTSDSEGISREKSVVSAKAGFGGRVIIDLRGGPGEKHRFFQPHAAVSENPFGRRRPASESSEGNTLNVERSVEHSWQQHRRTRRVRPSEKSAEDIFGNLLLVRRDINVLRRDLREVKALVHEISRKQNESDARKIFSDSLIHDDKIFGVSHLSRQLLETNFSENSSEPSNPLPALLMTSKEILMPLKAASVVTNVEGSNEITSNNSESGKFSDLANLTVETAHQVFPILIQPSRSTGNHSSMSGSIHHVQLPVLIGADPMRTHLVVDNGRESAKHGTLIRISDEGGKIKLQRVPNEPKHSVENCTLEDTAAGYLGGTGDGNDEEVQETRWPFNIDKIDFSVDSTKIVPKSKQINSPTEKSNTFSEQFLRTTPISLLSDSAVEDFMHTYTTTPQTTILTISDNEDSTDITDRISTLNSSTSLSVRTQTLRPTTSSLERYTYKEPDSWSTDEGHQQTTTPVVDDINSGVYEFHSTQQSPLWPDVLFQGG